ncbi:4,5-DOPA dioxygenase extradiol [Cognatilysobacter segetis]|uniref:4,5-DOPA-extradiol-dioxygenase n=1 Tax=Cognatilysobacter segetis TaxID=2492394 RepID=UPI00105F9CF8|nr:4,5-DOPA dioxygenase extradiol [Lysobacter segetis]
MSSTREAAAAFLGHGSPMNTLERNRYTDCWRAVGASLPKPRAILMVSAHWYVNATAVTAMAKPRTIHDFYGFPQALFDVRYPAPGLPELAEEVAEAARPDTIGADHDSWGLDHGTWSVLVHAYPDADVPVVQLSINALKPAEYHVELGARLAALRHRGVMLMGSGNVVHNLRAMTRDRPDAGFDWARRFDEHAREVMTTRPGDAAELVRHPDFRQAAPTPEHFLPLLYIAGFAAATGVNPTALIDGYTFGSLSMTSYGVGVPCPPSSDGLPGAAPLGSALPAEDSNV